MDLSIQEARRLALGAQGFDGTRSRATPAKLRKLATRLKAFQIDSVNVLVRAHYMPAFSRLGPYPTGALDTLAYDKRELFEFWGHAACLLPMSLYPYFRWRMDNHASADYWRKASPAVKRFVEGVYRHVADHGPIAASELPDGGKSKGNWWGWSDGKSALESLWRMGRLAVAGRRNFERLYDVPERVIPTEVRQTPTPSPDDARKHLLVLAADALGVGTARDVAGYFHVDGWWDRQKVGGKRARSEVPRLMRELVEERRLQPATVEGWSAQAYVVLDARIPRPIDARAIVSPFDPLMWDRVKLKEGMRPVRLFGFDYQIEIYVPEPKRVYGYYVLPFLLGDRFVARVDLKADRKTGALLAQSAWREPHAKAKATASELASELRLVASWLGLERIEVAERGDLARPLRLALR